MHLGYLQCSKSKLTSFLILVSAPFSSRSFTTGRCALCAAMCSAVQPFYHQKHSDVQKGRWKVKTTLFTQPQGRNHNKVGKISTTQNYLFLSVRVSPSRHKKIGCFHMALACCVHERSHTILQTKKHGSGGRNATLNKRRTKLHRCAICT